MKNRWIAFWALVLAFVCVGCGTSEKSQVKSACQDFFSAYSSLDGETAGALISGNKEGIAFSELQGALSGHISAKIKSVSADGNTASANVAVRSVDVAAVFRDVPETVSSQDDAKAYLIEAFSKDDAPMAEFEVELRLVKQEELWRIQMTPALSDALLGGYNTLVDAELEKAVG